MPRKAPTFLPARNARQRAKRRDVAFRWVMVVAMAVLVVSAFLVRNGS